MRLVVLFGLFLLISGIYPVQAQLNCDNEQKNCKEIYLNRNNKLNTCLTDEQIIQEKQNLLFMINLAMRGLSSNNAERDMRKNKSFCDFLNFSVPKGFFSPSGYSSITCMNNTLQLDFGHLSKKDFSVWDEASIGYNLKSKADAYRTKIQFIEKDFTDILDLQFVKKEKKIQKIQDGYQISFQYQYQWKLNSAINVYFSVAENTFLQNKQYPEYINLIYITREGGMKNIPSK